MTQEERKITAQQPIVWTSDLANDCTAEWAGLMLRAERIDEEYWWWAVYDRQKNEVTIDHANEYQERVSGVEAARKKAETVAKNYIAMISYDITAKYAIADTFMITGRGLVLAGHLTEGIVSPGDIIEFAAFFSLRRRRIRAVGGMRTAQPNKINTGLLIECKGQSEIDELRNWKPGNEMAIIYQAQ